MRRKIILITEDGGFAARLASSLERKHPGECEISAFASPEAAEESLRAEKRRGTLVAADPAFFGTIAGSGDPGGSRGVCILSEQREEAGFPGIPAVYKYAGTEEIYRLFVRESAGNAAAGSAAGGGCRRFSGVPFGHSISHRECFVNRNFPNRKQPEKTHRQKEKRLRKMCSTVCLNPLP